MLATEFDMDIALKVAREEALEEGFEKGIQKGSEKTKKELQNYMLDLIEQGLTREEIKKKIKEML